MEAQEKISESAPESQEAQEEHKTKVWRGTPRAWERCLFCDLRKECARTGVVRGSKTCMDARYTLARKK